MGKITDGQMIMNDAGKMIEKWYLELENKFPDIKCDAHVIMPNHFHCIIENLGANRPIPVERNGPIPDDAGDVGYHIGDVGEHFGRGEPMCSPIKGEPMCSPIPDDAGDVGEDIGDVGEDIGDVGERIGDVGERIGSPLHRVMQWFGTMT
ncbi:MAG: hypothetical protein M3R25_14165, partial [Bacteroidota bacterium]|nr:hypothetical protein [Bacteroidota bacterium]